MKVKLSLVLLFCLNLLYNNVSAQVIEKAIDFRYLNDKFYLKEKPDTILNRPYLLNMIIANDSVRVNSFMTVSGTATENGKKLYSYSGEFGLVTSNYFDQNLDGLKKKENVIINFPGNPSKKYEFQESAGREVTNTYGVNTVGQFHSQNPAIGGEKSPFPFDLMQEGSGFGKTKNANLVLNKINYTLTLVGPGMFKKEETKELVNAAEWKAKTKNLYLNDNLKLKTKLGDNSYIALVNRINPEDNYWTTKNFAFVIFDDAGNVIKTHEINFEFLRKLNSVVRVYDELGNQAGLLISFKNDSDMMGQNKKKDPVRNKFNLFYINNAGEIELKTDLIHGANPEKDDYFVPTLVVLQKNGQLNIINNYTDYSLRKNVEYPEKLIVDKSGKISSENLEPLIKAGKGLHPLNFSMTSPVYFQGAFYMANTQTRTALDGTITYVNSNVCKINADFTNPEMILTLDKGLQKDIILSYIEKIDNKMYSVICYAEGNKVVNLGDFKSLEIKYPSNFKPSKAYVMKNYVSDYEDKKLYFVLESKKAGNAKFVKVGL